MHISDLEPRLIERFVAGAGERDAYRQASRNAVITSLLARCELTTDETSGLETPRATIMDRRGEGVAIILERSERLSGRRPVYELSDESELRLTICAAGTHADPTL